MIKKVEASFDKQKKELDRQQDDFYKSEFNAPDFLGEFPVEIRAYDDLGNVTVANAQNTAGMILSVTKWRTPKTNWKPTDRFNIQDYNRIKGNLEYLNELANTLYDEFHIEDMGAEKTRYDGMPTPDEFNKFERNLEIMNEHIFTRDYGISQHFYYNGAYIQWQELTRIESAILRMRTLLDSQIYALRRLPFRLGTPKGIRI